MVALVEFPTEPEPERHLGYLLRRAQQRHVAEWTRLVSAEVSSVQYAVLVVLDQVGEASQRELCDAVDLDRSTIADLMRRMERNALIERRPDPYDARKNTVTLTERGRTERHRLTPLVEEVQRALVVSLTEREQAALKAGLRSLLAADRYGADSGLDGRSG